MSTTVNLFEYAAYFVGKYDKDGTEVEAPSILIEPVTILARDESHVATIAARALPEEYVSKLEFVQVVVRPF